MITAFAENLAHFVHGAAFMFFVSTSARLYPLRNRDNMMRILFVSMIFIAFLELKDICFLIPGVWADSYVSDLVMGVDMLYVPVMALFMFEVISPGWVRKWRAVGLLMPSVVLLLVYAFYPVEIMFKAMIVYAVVFGCLVLAIVFLASSRYDNYIRNNFSQLEGVSVSWVRRVILALFVCLALWAILMWKASWWGDALFYGVSIVIWMLIYHFSLKHAVVVSPGTLKIFPLREKPVQPDDLPPESYSPFVNKLQTCMEEKQLFLNSRLTLGDVAVAIGTNRTYLSDYLNRHLHTSFYEYVNRYRVQMARGLLISEERRSLAEIAERCGFNSLSTFNRAFLREVGQTPAKYVKNYRTE